MYRLEAVMYDPEEAQQLEATVASEKAHVQRCREKVDDLSSRLPGMYMPQHQHKMAVMCITYTLLEMCDAYYMLLYSQT